MNAESRYPYNIDAECDRRSAQVIQVESSKLLVPIFAVTLIACLLSGLAFAFAISARDEARRAQMRADQLQLEVESFKNVLHAHKLPTWAHLPGESP